MLKKIALAAAACFMGFSEAHAEDTAFIVPSGIGPGGDQLAAAMGEILCKTGPSGHYRVIDAVSGRTAVSIDVPPQKRYRVCQRIAETFRTELRTLRTLAQSMTTETDGPTDMLAALQTLQESPVEGRKRQHVLVFADLLFVRPGDERVSMIDQNRNIRIPSGGALVANLAQSDYGWRESDTDAHRNRIFHFCYDRPNQIARQQESEAVRLWVSYLRMRGGEVATVTDDTVTCIERFAQKESSPVTVEVLDTSGGVYWRLLDKGGMWDEVPVDRHTGRSEIDIMRDRLADMERQAQGSQAELDRANEALAVIRENPLEGEKSVSIFVEAPFPGRSGMPVVTGTEYNPTEFPRYNHSWCYFRATDPQGVLIQVDLGSKRRGGRVVWAEPNASALEAISYSRRDVLNAREACRFLES